jgi:FlaA1/EpsC-like NDP-sugar epimerase
VVIYGAGRAGKLTLPALNNINIPPAYFVDSNPRKHDKRLLSVTVLSPNELAKEEKDGLFVIIASSYSAEISPILDEMGFEENLHYVSILTASQKVSNDAARKERVLHGVIIGKYSYHADRLCYPGTYIERIGAFCSITIRLSFRITRPL